MCVWGRGGAILDSLCRVGRSVSNSCPLYNSFTNGGFPSNLNDTFTSTRGCAEPMLPMCQLKVKVTVQGQYLTNITHYVLSALKLLY